jgi:hypothetical protein
MNKIFLDAREMEHPQPLQIALSHLQSMSKESYLYMLNIRKPIPLIEIAKERAFNFFTYQDRDEVWHILISRDREASLQEFLDV